MKRKFSFEYHVPIENNYAAMPDKFITVVVESNGGRYSDGSPMVYITPVIIGNHDLTAVKDWMAAIRDMTRVAQRHYENMFNNAHPIPTLDRFGETYESQLTDLS